MSYLRRKYKLEPTPEVFAKITAASAIRCTKKEAAAVLGVSRQTLDTFFNEHPEAAEAWDDGKEKGRASLRRLLWQQAQDDPAQARFLAKDTRWLQMDEGKDRVSDAPTNITNIMNLAPGDRLNRVEELQQKVLGRVETIEPGRVVETKPVRAGRVRSAP